MSFTKKEQEEAKKELKELLKPGDKVFLNIERVSRSGMTRHIKVYVFRGSARNPTSRWLSYLVAKALDWRYNKDTGGVVVGGCGMDMGFHLVYSLGCVLFNDGYALKHVWL